MTSLEPVAPLVSHRVNAPDTAQQRRLRGVKSYASIIKPIASIADKLEELYTAICPPLFRHDPHNGTSIISGKVPQSLEYLSLQTRLQTSKQYEEWEAVALRLDEFEGHNTWKTDEASSDYDVEVLKLKLVEVERIRDAGNLKDMLMYVRTALHRDIAGIGNPRLYRQSRIGTKVIIERYVTAVVELIETTIQLTASSSHPLPWSVDKMREMWLQTRQAFGRTALLLSGGGTLGMCHIGVVKALYEADALPRIISGASAGSIVASVCCAKTQEEIPALLQDFCYGQLDVFFKKEEESQKYSNMAKHFFTQGNLYDIQNLNRVMKIYLGDMTFLEAYNRTNRILNICVSNEDPREQLTVLNYVTAPNVLIWSAVAASCSVPLIYSPAKLYEKHPRTGELTESSQSWIDGSMNGDIPMERLSELFDVNHFIVSQVNPHIIPFLAKDEEVINAEMQDEAPVFRDVVFSMAKEELLFRLKMSAEFGIFPTVSTRLRALISQTYQGDINVVPQVARAHYLRILSNPTPDFMAEACEAGEKATWPKINRIRTRCAIENAVERAVKEACDYAEFSDSKVALRRNVYHKSMSQAHLRSSLKRSGSKGASSIASAVDHPRPVSNSGPKHRSTRSLHERVPVHWDNASLKRPDSSHAGDGNSADVSDISSEDPDIFSKDETEQIISDTELDSDTSPSLTQSYGKLAASRSQPVTPSIASRTFNVSPSLMTPLPTMTPIANTSSKRQSPAEATYKRIFHGVKKQQQPSINAASSSTKPTENAPLPRKSSKLKLNLTLKRIESRMNQAK